MTDQLRFTVSALLLLLMLFAVYTPAQAQTNVNKNRISTAPQTITTQAGGSSPVTGSGTPDRLVKWTGSSSTSYTVGDSIITEDKFGKVGIGTPTPTSKLTVQGMIEITLGGYKFPDGTVQTTAAKGISVPLMLTGSTDIPVLNVSNEGLGHAIQGRSTGAVGVVGLGDMILGVSQTGSIGVAGFAYNGVGILGSSFNGTAVSGLADTGLAGDFLGDLAVSKDVSIIGTLAKGGGSFKIDHPLDPANKYLYHSFVESPDMMNIYNGNITTDENGDAVITMPDYFEALNREFRYQLTVIGTFAQVIVASEIKGNRFAIKTNAPNVKVSWQVTGVRQDAWANKNRIPVEVEKEKKERGYYLHPEAHEQPEEKSIEWARNPKMMQQLKEMKEQTKQTKATTINH
jgi:hypothetical protein